MAESHGKRQRDLEALLAERKKYETWLAQLDARRGKSAEHVFTRVHADYSQRLDDVRSKLVGEADAITALVADLESRLATEHGEVTAKTDERAEAELRALVGEFSDKEWNSTRTKLDDAITERRARFDGTERELTDLKELLSSVIGDSPPPRNSAQQSAAAVVDDDLAEAAGVDSSDADSPMAVGTDVTEDHIGVEIADSALEAAGSDLEQSDPVQGDAGDEGESAGTEDSDDSAPSTLSAPDGSGSPDDAPGFDELAFLRSIAGTPAGSSSAAVISDNPAPVRVELTPARGRGTIDEPAPVARASAPIQAPESDGPSPLGVPTPRTSQAVRSLKCQECGTHNFPTEWYCERCGGELAAF